MLPGCCFPPRFPNTRTLDVGTRSEAASSVGSRASCVSELRIKAELAKLRATQVERAAEAEAAAKVRAARDQLELQELELRLVEEALSYDDEEVASQSRPALSRPASSAARQPSQHRSAASALPIDVTRERTAGWIEQLSNQPESDSSPIRRYHVDSALPKIKLGSFDGSPLEWPRWSSLFRALVHNHRGLSDTEKLTHLQSYLTGGAREAVGGLLCDGQLHAKALSELKRQFGTPRHVVQASLGRLLATPPAKNHELRSLRALSAALHKTVMIFGSMGYEADLAATANLEQVVAKLPRALAWRWGEHVASRRLSPAQATTLSDLDAWLRCQVDAGRLVCDSTGDVIPTKPGKPGPAAAGDRSRRKAFTVTAKSSRAAAGRASRDCAKCGGSHTKINCPNLPPTQ